LHIVLKDAFTFVVHPTEGELRIRIALLGGLAPSVDRFGIVLRNAFAFGVRQTEDVLRLRIPILRKRLKKAERLSGNHSPYMQPTHLQNPLPPQAGRTT
jgi:hypothetical protein